MGPLFGRTCWTCLNPLLIEICILLLLLFLLLLLLNITSSVGFNPGSDNPHSSGILVENRRFQTVTHCHHCSRFLISSCALGKMASLRYPLPSISHCGSYDFQRTYFVISEQLCFLVLYIVRPILPLQTRYCAAFKLFIFISMFIVASRNRANRELDELTWRDVTWRIDWRNVSQLLIANAVRHVGVYGCTCHVTRVTCAFYTNTICNMQRQSLPFEREIWASLFAISAAQIIHKTKILQTNIQGRMKTVFRRLSSVDSTYTSAKYTQWPRIYIYLSLLYTKSVYRVLPKMAKFRITHTMPSDSPRTVVFWRQRSCCNSNGVTLNEAPYRWGRLNSAIFNHTFCVCFYNIGLWTFYRVGSVTKLAGAYTKCTKIFFKYRK